MSESAQKTSRSSSRSSTAENGNKPIRTQPPNGGQRQDVVQVGRVEDECEADKGVLLATAMIQLKAERKRTGNIRALCDTGSEANLISKQCAISWNLPIKPINVSIKGVGGLVADKINGVIRAELCDQQGESTGEQIQVLVVAEISTALPAKPVQDDISRRWSQLVLADTNFDKPGEVDVMLGAGVWASIIQEGIMRNDSGLSAQVLGW